MAKNDQLDMKTREQTNDQSLRNFVIALAFIGVGMAIGFLLAHLGMIP